MAVAAAAADMRRTAAAAAAAAGPARNAVEHSMLVGVGRYDVCRDRCVRVSYRGKHTKRHKKHTTAAGNGGGRNA